MEKLPDFEESSSFLDNIKINVKPSNLWDYFNDHLTSFDGCMVEIAENPVINTVIYLSEEELFPVICVYEGDEQVYEVACISRDDATETLREIYVHYLFPSCKEDEDDEFAEREDIIFNREDELLSEFQNFLIAIGDEYSDYVFDTEYEELIKSAMDDVLEMLGREYGIPVYRPMFITDEETGEDEYIDYPYEVVEEIEVCTN